MKTLTEILAYMFLTCGVAMLVKASHLSINNKQAVMRGWWRRGLLISIPLLFAPVMLNAQQMDLVTATEAGNAIIMYLSATFAAVGIVAAGVAMMMGRQSIAKWAFAGAMVSGLAFAIVHTMWSNMGIQASNVGSFTP